MAAPMGTAMAAAMAADTIVKQIDQECDMRWTNSLNIFVDNSCCIHVLIFVVVWICFASTCVQGMCCRVVMATLAGTFCRKRCIEHIGSKG